MEKIDLRKKLAEFYPTAKRAMGPHLVDVPPARYVMIDGSGNPNSSERFQLASGALYATAYGAKFASKAASRDYAVMPLEGLWWGDRLDVFTLDRREEWRWTLMILQPDWVDEATLRRAIDAAVAKRKIDEWTAADLRIEVFHEGASAQVLHVGPYEAEAPVIERLHAFVAEQGLDLTGKHHEIYLGDPRTSAPEKLRTVLRQPVRRRS